jgi:hypothetical protein
VAKNWKGPRPVAIKLQEAVMFDLFPDSPAVIADFFISDQQHYEALYYPIRAGEITVQDLDRVLGDPEAITKLVNATPSNPHHGIVFGYGAGMGATGRELWEKRYQDPRAAEYLAWWDATGRELSEKRYQEQVKGWLKKSDYLVRWGPASSHSHIPTRVNMSLYESQRLGEFLNGQKGRGIINWFLIEEIPSESVTVSYERFVETAPGPVRGAVIPDLDGHP